MSSGGFSTGGGFNIMGMAPFARVPTFDWKDPNSLLAAMASTLPDYNLSRSSQSSSSSQGGTTRSSQSGSSSGSNDAFNNASGFGKNGGYNVGGVGGSGGGSGGGQGANYGYSGNNSAGGSSGRQGSSSGGTGGGFSASSSSSDASSSSQGISGQSAKMGGFGNVAAVMADQLMKQARFEQLFPWLQNQWGMLNAHNNAASTGPGPDITASPVWNPQQLQAKINAGQASNTAKEATNIAGIQEQLGGRGMGANSPLSQALMGQQQASTLAANSDFSRQAQQQAAADNAGQLLKSQTAREQQFANRANEDIERRKVITGQMNALLGALSGLV